MPTAGLRVPARSEPVAHAGTPPLTADSACHNEARSRFRKTVNTTMSPANRPVPPDPKDFLGFDRLLDPEERLLRDTVRGWVADRVLPSIGDWFYEGILPRELATELGGLGLLGMHLDGYGCPGASAVEYGLTCLELEAGDSGLRSMVSVQGSLAMFPIREYGSEDQRREWLPRMATGEVLGCFGLTEPDSGSDPSSMRTTARRDGPDWILNGTKTWISNGSVADVAIIWARSDDGVRGFIIPTDTPGFTARDIPRKLSLRASHTSELTLDDVRLPRGSGSARGVLAAWPAVLPEPKPGTASSGGRSAPPAPATRQPSTMPPPGSSSAGR